MYGQYIASPQNLFISYIYIYIFSVLNSGDHYVAAIDTSSVAHKESLLGPNNNSILSPLIDFFFFFLFFFFINSGDNNVAAIEPPSVATPRVAANWST
jgi:hypothetical protein